MTLLNLTVALAIAVGLAGIVVPVLPGALLVVAALLVWAWQVGTTGAWIVFAVAISLIAVGQVVKYTIPGKKLSNAGVPNQSLLLGGVLGIVGFFTFPPFGLLIGFVLGVYLYERHRVGAAAAWPSTRAAISAVGLSILIELVSACLGALCWVIGVWFV